jgi:hypothetical protein
MTTEPYITVVAAPSLGTLGTVDANYQSGLSLSDFWEDMVLTPFGLPADSSLHCPLMAAAEGVSYKVKLPGIMDVMQDTQPLFFPYGQQVAATVQLTTESHYHTFYLPEVCGLLLGLALPRTVGFEDYLASIQSLKSDYHHFVQVLHFGGQVPYQSFEPTRPEVEISWDFSWDTTLNQACIQGSRTSLRSSF